MYIMIFKIKASKHSIECVYKSALVWNIETTKLEALCCIVVVNYIKIGFIIKSLEIVLVCSLVVPCNCYSTRAPESFCSG